MVRAPTSSTAKVIEVRGYLDEIETALAHSRSTSPPPRRTARIDWLADTHAKYGRRIGWYALVRALKPKNVVETGTDKGLGTLVIAAALMRNGTGRLTSIDINPAAGYLLSGPYAEVTDLIIADGVATLATLSGVDSSSTIPTIRPHTSCGSSRRSGPTSLPEPSC